MLNFKLSNFEAPFSLVANNILGGSRWQLVSNNSRLCLFKNKQNNRIFQLRRVAHEIILERGQMVEVSQDLSCRQDKNSIFLQIISIDKQYYLCQKQTMVLEEKFSRYRRSGYQQFNQEQIINTFTPILNAIIQRFIPSFYPLNSSNIVIDCHKNIRLKNGNQSVYSSQSLKENYGLYSLNEKMAIVLLQAMLLVQESQAAGLLSCKDDVILKLTKKKFSIYAIALVFLLFAENTCLAQSCLREWIQRRLNGQWYTEIQNFVQKISSESERKLEKSPAKHTKKSLKRLNRGIDDETEDSQNQTVAKYRQGKRINNWNTLKGKIDFYDGVQYTQQKKKIKKGYQ